MLGNKTKLTIFLIFIILLSSALAAQGFYSRKLIVWPGGDGGTAKTHSCCTYDAKGVANCSFTTSEYCTQIGGYIGCELKSNNTNPTQEASISLKNYNTEATTTIPPSLTPTKNYPRYSPNKQTDPFIIKLMADIRASGIGDRKRDDKPISVDGTGTYVCHNFVDDLQQYLVHEAVDNDSKPYDTTFTAELIYYAGRPPLEGHAYVDIHKNGKVLFIEAQSGGTNEEIIFAELDVNIDGVITAHNNQQFFIDPREITERKGPSSDFATQINIYDSKAAAKAYGVLMEFEP